MRANVFVSSRYLHPRVHLRFLADIVILLVRPCLKCATRKSDLFHSSSIGVVEFLRNRQESLTASRLKHGVDSYRDGRSTRECQQQCGIWVVNEGTDSSSVTKNPSGTSRLSGIVISQSAAGHESDPYHYSK